MIGFLAVLFVLAFFITLDLVPLVRRMARKSGFLDMPGPRKIHTEPVPYGGGIAVAAGVLGTIGAGLAAAHLHAHHDTFSFMPEVATRFVRGIPLRLPTLGVYAMGSLVILLLGLADDRRPMKPAVKLVIQTVVALGVALGGERLDFFDSGPVAGVIVTVLWILAVTNAFNLLDHMDGLSTGVASIAGLAFLVVAVQTGQVFIAAMLAPLLGACAGFLVFNFPPARMFLGDGGSLFLGYWLSCLTVSFTFYEGGKYELYTYLVPLAVLSVPLFDTAGVVIIRLRHRKPVFQGDTNHLAHRLVALGMSRRRAVLTVYALTLFGGIAAVLLYHVRTTGAVLIFLLLLLTFGIMTLLEASGRSRDDAV